MPQEAWDFDELFDSRKVVIEIGSGNGTSSLAYAKEFSDQIIIVIDVYTPGVAQLMYEAERHQINNLRVVIDDAIKVFQDVVPNESLSALHIFFPDPWPKQRHHKRRILKEINLETFRSKLKPGAKILVATDWEQYAQVLRDQFNAKLNPRPTWRPVTKFEKKAIKGGRRVIELIIE